MTYKSLQEIEEEFDETENETKEKRTQLESSNQADYRQLYDISQTPTYFLLDDKKRIIAKGLSLEQYDGLIDAKLKSVSSSQ